jgi:hypothetical protein
VPDLGGAHVRGVINIMVSSHINYFMQSFI